jgi:hypothetical protein
VLARIGSGVRRAVAISRSLGFESARLATLRHRIKVRSAATGGTKRETATNPKLAEFAEASYFR